MKEIEVERNYQQKLVIESNKNVKIIEVNKQDKKLGEITELETRNLNLQSELVMSKNETIRL